MFQGLLISPCCPQPFLGHLQQFSGIVADGGTSLPQNLFRRISRRLRSGRKCGIIQLYCCNNTERTPLNINHINMPLEHHHKTLPHRWRDRGRIFPLMDDIRDPYLRTQMPPLHIHNSEQSFRKTDFPFCQQRLLTLPVFTAGQYSLCITLVRIPTCLYNCISKGEC